MRSPMQRGDRLGYDVTVISTPNRVLTMRAPSAPNAPRWIVAIWTTMRGPIALFAICVST